MDTKGQQALAIELYDNCTVFTVGYYEPYRAGYIDQVWHVYLDEKIAPVVPTAGRPLQWTDPVATIAYPELEERVCDWIKILHIGSGTLTFLVQQTRPSESGPETYTSKFTYCGTFFIVWENDKDGTQ